MLRPTRREKRILEITGYTCFVSTIARLSGESETFVNKTLRKFKIPHETYNAMKITERFTHA